MLRSAFSLMELMLVVVIIGIVYAMALSSFKAPDTKDLDAVTLLTLPKYLRDNFALQDVKLVCFEPCGKCRLLVDDEWQEKELELFDSSDVTSYSLDIEGFAEESEFAPHDKEDSYKKACFILHKRVNNAIDPLVLQSEDRFIYYKAAYEEVKDYESLSAIQDEYKNAIDMIRNEQ